MNGKDDAGVQNPQKELKLHLVNMFLALERLAKGLDKAEGSLRRQ